MAASFFSVVSSTFSVAFSRALPLFCLDFAVPPARFSGVVVGVAVAVWVGVAVTVGAVVAVGVGVVSVEPRSTIEATAAGRPGIWSWSTGVPSGTSTVIVSCWPVTSVTRT